MLHYTSKLDNAHFLEGAPRTPRNDREQNCPYCWGYGYRPRRQDEPSGMKAVRCDICDGVGLLPKSF